MKLFAWSNSYSSSFAFGAIALAMSNIFIEGIFLQNFSTFHLIQCFPYKINTLFQCNHKSCHSGSVIFKLSVFVVIRTEVLLNLQIITLPYLTTENRCFVFLNKVCSTNNLSDASFVAPYKLDGLDALSVESAITFSPLSIHVNQIHSTYYICFNTFKRIIFCCSTIFVAAA